MGSLTFDDFIARHGEPAVQAMIENWERHTGKRPKENTPLRERWETMAANAAMPAAPAAPRRRIKI